MKHSTRNSRHNPAPSTGASSRLGVFAVVVLLVYLALPITLAYDNPGLYVVLAVLAAAVSFVSPGSNVTLLGASPQLGKLALGILVALVIGIGISAPMLRADAYRELLGPEIPADFNTALPPLDASNAPLVSRDMAARSAEKKLSEIPALGSSAELGTLQKQLIGGRLYWVAFLEHKGFFAWNNKSTTPGYVRVSATDALDVELVTQARGKPLALRYMQSAYFGSYALRHLKLDGYATRYLSDFSPEVDEEGYPYIVATVTERKVGFSGEEATGVVVLDPQTGEHQYYPVASAPEWIDRVQPESLVEAQIADRIEFVNGWLNPSNTDKLKIAGELDLVYGSDGKAYYYAGLTSVGRDGGQVGFMLVNTRTKEVTRYSMVGVTEDVAQRAAEGVMPEKQYQATNALPFVVGGDSPVYAMALRDATGIARAYAVVDIRTFQRVAVADTLSAAVRSFQSKAGMDRTSVDGVSATEGLDFRAKVLRIGQEIRRGDSVYLLLLAGHPEKLFSVDLNRAEDLAVTEPGDIVSITTVNSDQRVLPVLSFKNEALANPAPPVKP